MELIEKIIKNAKYQSEIHSFKESHFGKYVYTGLGPPLNYRVGRLVQVRLEDGEFGSDNVLLRHYDDTLTQHSNQSFYIVSAEFKDELDILFKNTSVDSIEIEYTKGNGIDPETGFLIPSKIGEDESTPMRDIKRKLTHLISEKFGI